MEIENIEIGSQKAQLFKIPKSDFWYLRLSIDGRRKQVSTKCKELPAAKDFASDWIMTAKTRVSEGRQISGTSFKKIANAFIDYETATKAHARNKEHITNIQSITDCWLIPYFHEQEALTVEEIRAKHLDEFLAWRMKQQRRPQQVSEQISPQTQKHYMQVMRRILKYAIRQDVIEALPLFPEISLKKHVRGWFEPDEYKHLLASSRKRVNASPNDNVKKKRQYIHNFIIFAVGCGARISELQSLNHRNVERVDNFCRLTVNGKTGPHEITAISTCRDAYEAIVKHAINYDISHGEDDPVFPFDCSTGLKALLRDCGLYHDKYGRPRTARNFRHTHIMFRILNGENLDLKTIADNLDTSVQTIDKHYAEVSNRLNEPALLSMKSARL